MARKVILDVDPGIDDPPIHRSERELHRMASGGQPDDRLTLGLSQRRVLRSRLPSVVADMSAGEMRQMRRRCVEIGANAAAYDRDLVALCRMIQQASR